MLCKTCTKCHATKPVSQFHKSNQRPDGLTLHCGQCKRDYTRRWRERNPSYQKEWRVNNPNYKKEYRNRDLDKARAIARKETAQRRSSPKGRVDDAFSAGIRDTLRRGQKRGTKWEILVGYTVAKLMAHLEKLFRPGMCWENYGRGGWHIDHIIPRAAFNYQTPQDIDFKRCWALSNLQPLWERENIAKGAKLTAPFQPSLALAANHNKSTTNT